MRLHYITIIPVSTVPTLSDTKRAFYAAYTRPVNSLYRRVVEELMVEMHLLVVNINFVYDPIYALGVVASFDRFMEGYQPQDDQNSIFNSLCTAVKANPQQYRQDAEHVLAAVSSLSIQDLINALTGETAKLVGDDLSQILAPLYDRPSFKYTRLFSIGLFTLIEKVDAEFVKNQEQFTEALSKISAALALPFERLKKDLELYQSNLNKLGQARVILAEAVESERKKREQRLKDKADTSAETPEASEEGASAE